MQIEFDEKYDTLTITFATSPRVICLEDRNGVLYRVDPQKCRLLGITILGFSHRARKGGFVLRPYFKICESKLFKKRCAAGY